MDGPYFLKDLKFISNDYIIYKKGIDITGHIYGYRREIRIKQNTEGDESYRVTIYKLEGSRAVRNKLLPAMQMTLVELDNLHIQLRNTGYGLILHLNSNSVEQVILKRYDSSTDTIFIKAPSKELEQKINIPLPVHLRGLNAAAKNRLIERYQIVVNEMQDKGRAAEAISNYYLFLGKMQLSHGAYREAKQAFTQSIMILIFNAVKPGHEAYYWFGKVSEVEGNTSEAKTFYQLALERYTYHPEFVSREEIIMALNE